MTSANIIKAGQRRHASKEAGVPKSILSSILVSKKSIYLPTIDKKKNNKIKSHVCFK